MSFFQKKQNKTKITTKKCLSQKHMGAQNQPIGKNKKTAACAMKGLYLHSG